jgi:hypothetical protein
MDDTVLAAMARWPHVPDVFGWLSLSARGQWRLHPAGDAMPAHASAPGARAAWPDGEAIGSPAIAGFIDRNYGHDAAGRWFFQNGPQRVFVRLDAAPYILRTTGSGTALRTHNGLDIRQVASWVLDDLGRLFATTDIGPGMVAGRDLPGLAEALRTTRGETLADALARDASVTGNSDTPQAVQSLDILPVDVSRTDAAPDGARAPDAARTAPLRFSTAGGIAATLGFVRFPRELPRPA